MPDEKGQTMPTADLHGSTIQIETGKGERTTFELVRLGTLKEFETVKEVASSRASAHDASERRNHELRAKLDGMSEKLEEASNAYAAQKDTIADMAGELAAEKAVDEGLAVEVRDLKGVIRAEREVSAEWQKERAELITHIKDRDGAVNGLRDELGTGRADCETLRGELAAAKAESARRYDCHGGPGMSEPACGGCAACLTRIIEAKDAEIDNLMQTKAALEETQTALEVREKELCEERSEHRSTLATYAQISEDHDAAKAAHKTEQERCSQLASDLATVTGERDFEKNRRQDLDHDIAMACGELDDVKAQLTETNKELGVTMTEHARYRKERDDLKAAFASLNDKYAREQRDLLAAARDRDASRQALADLKAELLTEGNRFKTILDTLAEKITGE